MDKIVLMLNYARSGGTLLNKCLASLPDVVMLSEVNPLGGGSGSNPKVSTSTIKDQLKAWYSIDIKSNTFKGQIQELHNYCEQNNKNLIIRDWSFVNFSKFEKYNQNSPPNKFLILEELKDFDLKIFGFIRDSIDVWLSRGYYNVDEFYGEYVNYIDELIKVGCPIFKYEDFVKHPQEQLKKIGEEVGVAFSNIFDTCLDYDKLNGDVQNKNKSRGIKQQQIKILPRKKINSEKITEINQCEKMKMVNAKFGYPVTYYNSFWKDTIIVPAKNFIKRIVR
ncbi:MAG: hypothetical protein GXO80_02850 [Chlorobi bacterium]|nr:hypothetical protein [Chlorobiota bacterium]